MTPSLNLIQSGAYRVCLLKQESGSLSAISVYGQLGSTECLSLIKKLLLSRYLFQFSSDASLWPWATAGLTLCWLRLEPHHEGANTPASDAEWRELVGRSSLGWPKTVGSESRGETARGIGVPPAAALGLYAVRKCPQRICSGPEMAYGSVSSWPPATMN